MGLTNRRRVFVEEYLRCWNASEAARRAGYTGRANTIGPRLLANVGIQETIKARLADLTMGADEVLVRLTEQARASIGEFVDENGEIEWGAVKAHGHLVKRSSVVHGKFGDNTSIELHDPQHALELIGKHLGLFTERLDVTTKGKALYSDFERIMEKVYGDSDAGGDSSSQS